VPRQRYRAVVDGNSSERRPNGYARILHLETRSPKEVAKILEEKVPWRYEDGRLVKREWLSSCAAAANGDGCADESACD